MKLLFDQNISHRILRKIINFFPESEQVKMLGLENSTDLGIWNYARLNGYTIVTFDADFFEISNLNGHPTKVLWLRMGNTTTQNIAESLIEKSTSIQAFIKNEEYTNIACLEIVE